MATRSRPASRIALHLDPQTLRVLIAIDDYRSFTGAAAAVSLVPSAISRRVQELEAAIGFELVRRSPRSVEFTVAGKALLTRVRRILDEMDGAVSDLEYLAHGLKGVVKVATSMFALHAGLPAGLAAFKARYPGIDLDLETQPSSSIVAALQRREIDLGIFAASAMPEGLRTRIYSTDRIAVMVPAGHRLAKKSKLQFRHLGQEELLQLPQGSDIGKLLDEQAARQGVPLRRSYRVGSLDAAVAMARAGLGLAVIPKASWDSLGPMEGLVLVPIDEPWATAKLLLGTAGSTAESSAAYRLFSELSGPADPAAA